MKPYLTLDLVNFEKLYKHASFIRKLQDTLQNMEFPDLAGIQIASFAEQNLEDDGNGNLTIAVNILENQVALGATNTVYLRNNAGTLQYSNDGTAWADVGSGGGSAGRTPTTIAAASVTLTDADLHSQQVILMTAAEGYVDVYLPAISAVTTATLPEIEILSRTALRITASGTDLLAFIVADGSRFLAQATPGVIVNATSNAPIKLMLDGEAWIAYGYGAISEYEQV